MAIPEPRLFHESWWMDATCTGGWERISISENGQEVGILPFTTRRRHGLTLLGQPPLTPHLGPWILPGAGKSVARISLERKRTADLLDKLPEHFLFRQRLQPGDADPLPWRWRQASLNTAISYRIDLGSTADSRWEAFESTTRSAIRKAQESVTISTTDDAALFWDLHLATFGRKNMIPPYERSIFIRLDHALATRNRRQMRIAYRDGKPLAGIYLVWDHEAICYLMSAGDPRSTPQGTHALLLWSAIEHPVHPSRWFDFCGSLLPGVERFVRGFGGIPFPLLEVQMGSRLGMTAGHLQLAWQALTCPSC